MITALGFVSTCDRHEREGFYVTYQTRLEKCPYCALEKQLEDARERVKDIQNHLAREAERLGGAGS